MYNLAPCYKIRIANAFMTKKEHYRSALTDINPPESTWDLTKRAIPKEGLVRLNDTIQPFKIDILVNQI